MFVLFYGPPTSTKPVGISIETKQSAKGSDAVFVIIVTAIIIILKSK